MVKTNAENLVKFGFDERASMEKFILFNLLTTDRIDSTFPRNDCMSNHKLSLFIERKSITHLQIFNSFSALTEV